MGKRQSKWKLNPHAGMFFSNFQTHSKNLQQRQYNGPTEREKLEAFKHAENMRDQNATFNEQQRHHADAARGANNMAQNVGDLVAEVAMLVGIAVAPRPRL